MSCSIARNHSKDGEGAEEGEAGTDGLLLAVGFTNGVFSLNQLVPTFQEIHSLSISQVCSPLLAPFHCQRNSATCQTELAVLSVVTKVLDSTVRSPARRTEPELPSRALTKDCSAFARPAV